MASLRCIHVSIYVYIYMYVYVVICVYMSFELTAFSFKGFFGVVEGLRLRAVGRREVRELLLQSVVVFESRWT